MADPGGPKGALVVTVLLKLRLYNPHGSLKQACLAASTEG
jgi:hypothetical protein